MPLGSDVGENIKELRRANRGRTKKRPKRQIIAIALESAREAGADIKKPKSS